MKKLLFFVLLSLLGASAFAQSDVIISTVTLCITEGRYADADRYLDSLLKIDPNSIDAMMMKGNVLLNYTIMQTPAMNLITADDESIYSQDIAGLKTPTVLIPREQALKIEKLWKRCVELDSGRLDIREGLCTVYGMADMRKELLGYLPVMARAGKEKGDGFVNVLMQYAQLLSDRGDQEGSYEVYKKIAALYPSVSSVPCQLATAYSSNGDLANAKTYADKSFAMASPDMAACGDALDLYSVLGEYEKALSVMKAASHDSAFIVYPFYDGIYRYAHHDTSWRREILAYVTQFAMAPDSDILYDASKYMLSPEFKDSYNDFAKLLTFSNSDFYTMLITDRAMHDYRDSILPYMAAAEMSILGHNYAKANRIYAGLEKSKLDTVVGNEYKLQYAYSLYSSGEYVKALAKWNELNKVQDPAFFAVTNYFIAQCHLKSGNKNKALIYLHALTESNDESKYGYLAKLELEKLSKK